MNWIFWVIWVGSIFLATSFMAFYIRIYHKSEGIIAVYVIYLALSQILAIKIANFNIKLLGAFSAPTAVLLYPFTYQLTDTINEHFGKQETLKMILIAFITQVLMVIFLYFGNHIPPADFWEATVVSNEMWITIFQQSFSITFASWISFLITSYLDTLLFQKIKQWTHGKYLWLRSVVSDVPMLFLDSMIFVGLAFGVFQGQPWNIVWGIMLGQIVTKWIFGVVDTPFIYLDRWIVKSQKLEIFDKIVSRSQKSQKVVLILSGGLDSTTLLYRLIDQGKDVSCISFDYHQKHSKELLVAKNTCTQLAIPHKVVSLEGLIKTNIFGQNALTSEKKIPEGHYTDETMKDTVVPNRNMVMLSIALSYAITIGASAVYYGAHAGDHAIYPDCRPEFLGAMDQVSHLCDYSEISIKAPFLYLDKSEIIREGLKLGVDYSSTWTCYKGEEKPCGNCGSCVERLEAFQRNQVTDPLDYE